MRKILRLASGLDCAHLIRHFSLCLGAGVALVHPGPLRVGNAFLGLVALAAVLNFLIAFLSERAGFTKVAHALSAGSGVFGWAALAWVTGGSSSPFVAGFWLEIVLSALTFVNWGTLVSCHPPVTLTASIPAFSAAAAKSAGPSRRARRC